MRLGHPSERVLNQVLHFCNKKFEVNEKLPFCDACQFGKSHLLPFKSSVSLASKPLELVHTYILGPSPIQSSSGFRYYIHFIDDYSRYTWIYPLKFKSDAFKTFVHFKNLIENQLERKIKCLQSDMGGEYQSFIDFVKEQGVEFRHSCPYTSVQNGRAERKHRHIVETRLTLLAQAHMPLKF